jgi:3-oxoacyl-[acyl-carrier-protein] synthase-1
MNSVYCRSSNIICSLGLDTETVWNAVQQGISGIHKIDDPNQEGHECWVSELGELQWNEINQQTQKHTELSPLERMAVFSIEDALQKSGLNNTEETLFIFSSTKGNIEWMNVEDDQRNRLSTSAALIAECTGLRSKRIVVSQACISGLSALIIAFRALSSGRYKHAVVCGADRLSPFVLAGFGAFHALASGPCRPFDESRDGINLGEAAATIVLSTEPGNQPLARICGGSSSNDANHISGPSRTGGELAQAINLAMNEASIKPQEIAAISAHGTATRYNDEMESKAFAIAGLMHAPLHSLKGYVGHTLGAASLLESAMLIESLRHGRTIASAGFEQIGVPTPVQVSTTAEDADIRYALKTASGFGGCNAAMVFGRV